jgi:hypothetical protein
LAEGHQALGNLDKAFDLAVTASEANPRSERIERQVETIGVKRLKTQLPEDLSRVTDPQTSNQISETVNQLERLKAIQPENRLLLSRGMMAIGQTNEARTNFDRTLKTNLNLEVDPKMLRLFRTNQ